MQGQLFLIKSNLREKISVKAFNCELCEYKCEKPAFLKEHMNFKYTVHKCKVSKKEFKTSLKLVSLIAEKHHEDDEAMNFQFHSSPKSDGENYWDSRAMLPQTEPWQKKLI